MKSKSGIHELDMLFDAQLNPGFLCDNRVGNNSKHFSVFRQKGESLRNVVQYIEDQCLEDGSEKVCVVSVVGKTAMQSFNDKTSLLDHLVGQNVVNPQFGERTELFHDKVCPKIFPILSHLSLNQFVEIDGYYDVANRIILLHLVSAQDSWAMTNLYRDMEKQFIEKGFFTLWPNLLSDLFKSLLLIFSVSHIVAVSNPSPRFDISCINMFRILDATRVKLQPFVSEMLQAHSNLPSSLVKSGRLAVPHLLFIFEAHHDFDYITSDNVQHYAKQLEAQIMRIMRKSRLVSNMSANSLFSISSTNPFVFISTVDASITDYQSYFVDKILERCNNSDLIGICLPEYSQSLERCNKSALFNFLLPYINTVLVKGLEDPTSKPNCHLIKSKSFLKLLIAYKELIFEQNYSGISSEKFKNLQKILESLHSTLDIDNRFSEGRCSKLVANAISYYQEGLPPHYTREMHERKLVLTLQHFTLQSRGPALFKYIQAIQAECEQFWKSGHKMCEELSLTGNYCMHRVHRVPHDDYSDPTGEVEGTNEENATLPQMMHASMAKIISACDCGRRQGNREDPFTTKAANYDFYLKMKFKCHTCRNINRFKFSFYDNHLDVDNLSSSQNTGKSEARESPLMKTFSDAASSPEDEEVGDDSKHEVECDMIQQLEMLSMDILSNNGESMSFHNEDNSEAVGGQSGEIGKSECNRSSAEVDQDHEQEETGSSDAEVEDELPEDKTFLSDEELGSEPETAHSPAFSARIAPVFDVKTLPCMIHTGCPENIPARFASWSLVCLGPSSIYSHNMGVQDQQGFINGSHFLLPWNVTVMLQHAKNMPPLWEGKRPPGIKHKRTLRDGTQFTVKIFIGFEYECLRGHRFIASGPDQILKVSTNVFKETADIAATNDMPIYIHCICSRSGKTSTVAQLMRVHVVTPKAPIHVTLNPRVQISPNATPIFYPGNKEPVKLSQSTYWVLRLPMIYEADAGPLCYPKEPLSYCRLLKDMFGIADQVTKIKV